MPAARSAANHRLATPSLDTVEHLEVVLLPEGQVSLNGSELDAEAGWEVLGHTGQTGTTMGFIRVEMAGVSWATLIPKDRLGRIEAGLRVKLRRQSSVAQDPLVGWTLFC